MGWILWLYAVALGVSLGLAIAAVAGPLAALCVLGAAAHGFFVTLWRGVLHRGGANAMSGPDEPAFVAYYRSQVWRDLRLAAQTAWRRALDEATRIPAMVPRSHPAAEPSWGEALLVNQTLRLALAVCGYVGLALATLLMVAVSVVPVLLIVLVSLGAWAVGAPLRVFERLRRERRGTHFDCSVCRERHTLPTYECPACGARHSALVPSRHGVLNHRCLCGARLPAVGLLGRERLLALCPVRGAALGEGVGSVRTFHLPVAGGPSTGKSTFLAAALLELERAAASGTLATAVQSSSRDAYDRLLDGFRHGVLPAKTDDPQAPALVAEVRGGARSVLLYAYDVAGEVYGSEDELRRDPAYGLASGVLLLVDPFTLDQVRRDLADEIAATPQLGVSADAPAPQRALERLIGVLEEKGTRLAQLPATVCVTKTDALGIGDAIAASPGADDGERTRAWLEAHGAGNLLRAVETTFREMACFSVSALGRLPGTGSGAFRSVGTLEPLLWQLARAGVEPAASGAAQATRTEGIAGAPLDVTPKRALRRTPINALARLGYAGNLAVGAAALLLLSIPPAGLLLTAGVARTKSGPAPPPATTTQTSEYAYALRVPKKWDRVRFDDDPNGDQTFIRSKWNLAEDAYFKVDLPATEDTQDDRDLARSSRDASPDFAAIDYRQVEWRRDPTLGAWRWRYRLDDRDIEKVVWFFTPEQCTNDYVALGRAPSAAFGDHLKAFEAAVKSMAFQEC